MSRQTERALAFVRQQYVTNECQRIQQEVPELRWDVLLHCFRQFSLDSLVMRTRGGWEWGGMQ